MATANPRSFRSPSQGSLPVSFKLHPASALLTISALTSLSLEIELIRQLDSLRLYLTKSEIVLEAACAFLIFLALGFVWWLAVLLISSTLKHFTPNSKRELPISIAWILWISVPLIYVGFELLEDTRVLMFPTRHASLDARVIGAVVGITVLGVFIRQLGLRRIQIFCRTRLVPAGWCHIVVGVLAAVMLSAHGAHLFHDYVVPPRSTIVGQGKPDIYLITFDALRADDLSLYGYQLPTSSNMEKFAAQSFTFENFFANANFTTPATTSIETGKLPWSHRVFQGGGFLRGIAQEQTLAGVLHQHGYYTAMITSNDLAGPFRHRTLSSYDAVEYAAPAGLNGIRLRYTNWIGLNTQATLSYSLVRGLTTISSYLYRRTHPGVYPFQAETPLGEARSLVEQTNTVQPFFLWVHVFPPHDPYWPPLRFQHRFLSRNILKYTSFEVSDPEYSHSELTASELKGAYDEMICYADQEVGQFLDWLDRTGRLDNSIVIVSADHGESFEHDHFGHGGSDLSNGMIHIPLIVHVPGQHMGRQITQIAEQADLLPTILGLAGVPTPSWTDGISLEPAMENMSSSARFVFSMNLEPNSVFRRISKGTLAVMDGEYKLVVHLGSGKTELYRYTVDRSEDADLSKVMPNITKNMSQVLFERLNEVNRRFSSE